MKKHNLTRRKRFEGLSSLAIVIFILLIIVSVLFILFTVVACRLGYKFEYLRFTSTAIFGCIFFLPSFILLCAHLLYTISKTISQAILIRDLNKKGNKHFQNLEISGLYYIFIVGFALVCGTGSYLSSQAIVNVVKDYSFLNNPLTTEVDVLYINQQRSKNLSFKRKDYRLLGFDKDGALLEFKLIDILKIQDTMVSKAYITYLPNTKTVLEFHLQK